MRIIAGMATLPARHAFMLRVVDSILPQVDALHIYHDAPKKPAWFGAHGKVRRYSQQDTGGKSIGDAGKFLGLDDDYDYYLSIDDDLIYPPGYADGIVKWCRTLGHSLVSYHGRSFRSYPITSYYHGDVTVAVACLQAAGRVVPVDFPGTGCMCAPKEARLAKDIFRLPNMADIWVGTFARGRGLACYALPHPEGFLEYDNTLPIADTIWGQEHHADRVQTEIVNRFFAEVQV